MTANVYVGLGSNLGSREAALGLALHSMRTSAALHPQALRCSSIYETEPVPKDPPQPRFLNAVAAFRTEATPRQVMDELLHIELTMGRLRAERWGARLIDLDLLMVDHVILHERGLHVPHPHLHERAFVLIPLAELEPALVHPKMGVTVGALLLARSAEERAEVQLVGALPSTATP